MNQRDSLDVLQQVWDRAMLQQKFKSKPFNIMLNEDNEKVNWRNLIKFNQTRLRVVICLLLTCHGNLATKDRMKRFGMLQDNLCNSCKIEEESINHLLFSCSKTKDIWSDMLKWVEVNHISQKWKDEIR
ncbi:unnamed protein product [Lathyrus sativus]|nr:unnamed protein product [Lathyrus sativus]